MAVICPGVREEGTDGAAEPHHHPQHHSSLKLISKLAEEDIMSVNFNDPQRLQMLLNEKARVDAEIALLQQSTAQQSSSPHERSSGHRRYRPQEVPRSFSHSGSSMSRTLSTGHGQYDPAPMTSSISQHSAPAMARCGSKGSASSIPSMPFSNSTGHMPPSLHENRRHNSPIETFIHHQDDPVNDYTIGRPSAREPLEQVTELDFGVPPEVYFSQFPPAVSVTLSPTEVVSPTGQWRTPNPHRLSVSSQRRQSFGIQSPTTPSTSTLTTVTTPTEMSREDSCYSDGINGPFEMMTVRSNNSLSLDNNSYDDTPIHHVDLVAQSKRFSCEEQNFFVTGAIGGNQNSHLHSSGSEQTIQALPSSLPRDMKRSPSNESNSSTSSSKSRAAARLQFQIQVASRRIFPKAENEDDASLKKDPTAGSGLKSKCANDDRMAIPKAKTYHRPQHARVYCTNCQDFPDGFRGAHELGRHNDRQHKVTVKRFICVEPSDGIIDKESRPIISLAKCKACSTQKAYNAYYNAAAHLRRAHFKPKTRGRSKSTKGEDKTQKRGGNAGGHWPPMTELKRWMKEVNVKENAQPQADDEDCEDECIASGYDDDEDIMFDGISNMPTVTPAYGGDFQFNTNLDSSMIDPYPQLATTNFNTQSMPSMPSIQFLQQNIDMSMAYTSGQASFDSQPQLMNDSMTCMGSFMNDPFSQSYDLSQTDNLSYQTYNQIM